MGASHGLCADHVGIVKPETTVSESMHSNVWPVRSICRTSAPHDIPPPLAAAAAW